MTNKQLQSTIIPWRSSSSFHAIASFYMETKSLSRKFSRGKITRRFDANTRMSFASCLYFEWRLIDSRIEVCYSNKDKSVFQWKIHSSFQSDQLWQDYIISRCSGQILDIFVTYCPRSLLATYQVIRPRAMPGVLGGPRRQIIGFVWSEKSRAAARSSLRGQRVGTKESCRGHSMKTNNEINFTRLLFNQWNIYGQNYPFFIRIDILKA